jgi:hypothetical protein
VPFVDPAALASLPDRRAQETRRGRSHIFSVRTVAGERVSTLEVRKVAGAWRVADHCAKANRAPPSGAVAAGERFAETLPTEIGCRHAVGGDPHPLSPDA